MNIKKILSNEWLIGLLTSIIVSIPLILPYFHPGYFPTHDGEWAIVRLGDMFRILRDGQIPARFSGALNFGYGYPLFNFAYPFPYYLGIPFHFLHISFIDSIKILFAASVPLSAFFMFLASRKFWNNLWSGLVSSILYLYFPYRIVDLFVRGSIGESLAFVLFPIILFAGLKILETRDQRYTAVLAGSVGLLIGTHNIMTVFYLPIFVVIIVSKIVIENKKVKDIKSSLFLILEGLILGLGLSAFFFLPALIEEHNILLSVIPIADRSIGFVTFPQLLLSSWGYGIPGGSNPFTYQLGYGHILILAILIVALFFNRKEKDLRIAIALVGIYIVVFVLMFSPTAIIWKYTPFLKEINYPWILLSQLGFLTSLLAGYVANKKKKFLYVLILPVVISIYTVYINAKPSNYIYHDDNYYLTNEATTTSSHELMPLWVKKIPTQHSAQKVEVVTGRAKVSNISYDSKNIAFNYNSDSPSIVRISTIYYPGWSAFSNGKEKGIFYDNDMGLMELKLAAGAQNVVLKFGETPVRLFADFISLCSVVIALYFLLNNFFIPTKIKAKK